MTFAGPIFLHCVGYWYSLLFGTGFYASECTRIATLTAQARACQRRCVLFQLLSLPIALWRIPGQFPSRAMAFGAFRVRFLWQGRGLLPRMRGKPFRSSAAFAAEADSRNRAPRAFGGSGALGGAGASWPCFCDSRELDGNPRKWHGSNSPNGHEETDTHVKIPSHCRDDEHIRHHTDSHTLKLQSARTNSRPGDVLRRRLSTLLRQLLKPPNFMKCPTQVAQLSLL